MLRVRKEFPNSLFNQAFTLASQHWSKSATKSKFSKIAIPAKMAIAPSTKSLRAPVISEKLYRATAPVTRRAAEMGYFGPNPGNYRHLGFARNPVSGNPVSQDLAGNACDLLYTIGNP